MTTNNKPNGAALLSAWRASGMGKREYWRMYLQDEMTYGQFHGATWRAEQTRMTNPFIEFPRVDLGKAWVFPAGDYTICGDVHLNTVNEHFLYLMLAVAKKTTKRPRKLIVAGDLVNADAFSDYESDSPEPHFGDEVYAGRWFFREVLSVFDSVHLLTGNHDRRIGKKTRKVFNLATTVQLMTHDPRVEVSNWGHCVIQNRHGSDWRITHGSQYSINQLTVADQLAQKYRQNIISHHEHHLAVGFDRYGYHLIINNGGLFDKTAQAYTLLDDSKHARTKNGFTVLKDGYPTVYGEEPFTNWAAVLPEQARKEAA